MKGGCTLFLLEIHDNFSAAHAVRMSDGTWEPPHTHAWQLRIFLTRDRLNDDQMILDFGEAKRLLRTILDDLEGKNLREVSAIGPIPTAECVAHYIFTRFNDLLAPAGINVKSLALREAEDCWAWYCASANARL
jgi:6-pyruvoyl-tetrahydropterin synthase